MPKKRSYRSGLERRIAQQLKTEGIGFKYEPFKIPFVQPLKLRTYTPDFVFPNGVIVEAKGRWETADRQKFIMVTDTYPDLDIRFVFSNANSRLSKRSKTTYAKYCRDHGWKYASKAIPFSWLTEPKNETSIEAIKMILGAPCNT